MHIVKARYIAIDNVCAWPVLLKDPNCDDIYAIIHNSPSHGWKEGSLDCYKSEDGGHTWENQGTPAPHEPGENRIHIAAGWMTNGEIIVLSNGFKPDLENETRGNVRGIWTSTSKDKGKSWEIHKKTIGAVPDKDQIPFGRIHALKENELIATFYRPFSKEDSQTWSGISRDRGQTWVGETSKVNGTDGNESCLLPINDEGEWIAATRTHLDHHLDISRSMDFARNWTRESAVTLSMQHPADLTQLDNGKIILTYAIRNQGMQSIAYRISQNDGRTWSAPRCLVELKDVKDFGYPSTVQISDSSLITAYYSSGLEFHNRYHMGTILWRFGQN